MDARITKHRLSNLLAYDWIKILVVIAIAVTGICLFFTMVETRPGKYHVFGVYGYGDLAGGAHETDLADRLLGGVLSYDVLKVEEETFDTGNYYGDVTYMARRAAGQGTVMFVSTNPVSEEDPETTYLSQAVGDLSVALDLDVYLNDCERYLIRFFGENWRTGEADGEEVRKCFLNRNGSDNRYRSDQKKEEGIAAEFLRLQDLRDDYLFLLGEIENGTIGFTTLSDEEGNPHNIAFSLGNLNGLHQLFYYRENDTAVSSNICLFLFKNDNDAGRDPALAENDLRYEPVTFLRYLVERYR